MDNNTEFTLSKKAYHIKRSCIDKGYVYSEMFVHADNLNEAKSMLLDEFGDEFTIDGRCPTYITIPVNRFTEEDLFIFEDKPVSRKRIYEIQKERERVKLLDEVLADTSITHCYIKKRGDYYMPDCCGYTERRSRAGVYTKEKAVREAKCCEIIAIQPIDVEEHNAMIQREIDDLKTKKEMIDINKVSFLVGSEAKITNDMFVWKTISYDQARAIFGTGVIALFALNEDESESEIETVEDILSAESKGIDIGIEVGFVCINEE